MSLTDQEPLDVLFQKQAVSSVAYGHSRCLYTVPKDSDFNALRWHLQLHDGQMTKIFN